MDSGVLNAFTLDTVARLVQVVSVKLAIDVLFDRLPALRDQLFIRLKQYSTSL